MLTRYVVGKADASWARDFGSRLPTLLPTSTHVQEHAGELLGNEGIWILAVGEFPLLSLPPRLAPALRDRAQHWSRALVGDPAALAREVQPLHVQKIVGPAFIGFGVAAQSAMDLELVPQSRTLMSNTASMRVAAKLGFEEYGFSVYLKIP